MWNRNIRETLDDELSQVKADKLRIIAAIESGKRVRHVNRARLIACVAASILLLLGCVALATGGSSLFVRLLWRGPTMEFVAEHAEMQIETQVIDNEIGAIIDSIFFDGTTIMIAYRIVNAAPIVSSYYPMGEELSQMIKQPAGLLHTPVYSSSDRSDMDAFMEAYKDSIPCGYVYENVGHYDTILLDDDSALPLSEASEELDANDTIGYIISESPLPENIARQSSVNLSITFVRTRTSVWFDGESVYTKWENSDETVVTTYANKTASEKITMSGEGVLDGQAISVRADVTPTIITVEYPGGYDNIIIEDSETGERANQIRGYQNDDGEKLFQAFGFGRIPDSLTIYPEVIHDPPIIDENGEPTNVTYEKDKTIVLTPID
jgi:hypothetical protein